MEIKSIRAHMDMMLFFRLMVTKYIPTIMSMKLRIGLIGKINVFHLNHHLPMFYMYCILEFERGYHILQAYLPKWTEKRFCTEILV
jgi:hypothetical protein